MLSKALFNQYGAIITTLEGGLAPAQAEGTCNGKSLCSPANLTDAQPILRVKVNGFGWMKSMSPRVREICHGHRLYHHRGAHSDKGRVS